MASRKLVFTDANVVTMDPARPHASAIACGNGRITAVGSEPAVMRQAGEGAQIIGLGGRTVLPGFIDCHTHFLSMGVWIGRLDLGNALSAPDVLALVQKKAREKKKGEWVLGRGYDETRWADRAFPTRKELDEVAPANPVMLIRVCGHQGILNSRALVLVGRAAQKPGADAARGILRENALETARDCVRPGLPEMLAGLERATGMARENGVTSVHDIIDLHMLAAYRAAYSGRALGVRACLHFENTSLQDWARLGIRTGYGNHFLRAGGIKLYSDGSFGARTAALDKPYSDSSKDRGILLISRRKLAACIGNAQKVGIQVLIHAIGDRAVDATIGACSDALSNARRNLLHRIEHLELVDGAGLGKMKELGVWACLQPNFIGEWGQPGQMMEARLGKRFERADPLRRVLRSGVKMIFGSDCMPFSPAYGISCAVAAPFRDQRLEMAQAVAAYTSSAAASSFEDGFKGTLSIGKAADIAVLNPDFLEKMSPERPGTVEMTVLAGKIVYKTFNPGQRKG